jgi:hypothetical protein
VNAETRKAARDIAERIASDYVHKHDRLIVGYAAHEAALAAFSIAEQHSAMTDIVREYAARTNEGDN